MKFLDTTPPVLSPSLSFSPNNQSCTFSLFLVKDNPAPTAAPNSGPPIAPVTNDTPAPIKLEPIASGAYLVIFVVISSTTNPKDFLSSLEFPNKAFLVTETALTNSSPTFCKYGLVSKKAAL